MSAGTVGAVAGLKKAEGYSQMKGSSETHSSSVLFSLVVSTSAASFLYSRKYRY